MPIVYCIFVKNAFEPTIPEGAVLFHSDSRFDIDSAALPSYATLAYKGYFTPHLKFFPYNIRRCGFV
ncbi:MAG TPA: hypothetical protein VJI32_05035 [Candidatus Nanoarchaeia archaeon]|nr:hypothetical protein [Candidatus Nanoarchaeia archaeon]